MFHVIQAKYSFEILAIFNLLQRKRFEFKQQQICQQDYDKQNQIHTIRQGTDHF